MHLDHIAKLNPRTGDLLLYNNDESVYICVIHLEGHLLFATKDCKIFFTMGMLKAEMLTQFNECI